VKQETLTCAVLLISLVKDEQKAVVAMYPSVAVTDFCCISLVGQHMGIFSLSTEYEEYETQIK
jgi:hypothetical protein